MSSTLPSITVTENDNEPSWMSEETPLMGTGTLDLEDPRPPWHDEEDDDEEEEEDDDDDDDDDFDFQQKKQQQQQQQQQQAPRRKAKPTRGSSSKKSVSSSSSSSSTKRSSKKGRSGGSKNGKKKRRQKSRGGNNKDDGEEAKIKAPRKPCLLHVWHIFELISILVCLCMVATQLLPLFVVPLRELGFVQSALRCYISLFAIILLMVEARLQIGVLKAGLLQMYFSRGFLFTFLGIIGQEEAYSGRITDMLQNAGDELHVAWAALFMQITSWALFSIGCIYLMGGLCCIKVLRDKLEKDHKKRVEEYKEIAMEIEDEEY